MASRYTYASLRCPTDHVKWGNMLTESSLWSLQHAKHSYATESMSLQPCGLWKASLGWLTEGFRAPANLSLEHSVMVNTPNEPSTVNLLFAALLVSNVAETFGGLYETSDSRVFP